MQTILHHNVKHVEHIEGKKEVWIRAEKVWDPPQKMSGTYGMFVDAWTCSHDFLCCQWREDETVIYPFSKINISTGIFFLFFFLNSDSSNFLLAKSK